MTTRSPLKGQAVVAALFCAAALLSPAFAADSPGEPGRGAGGKNPLKNVYFGEQHLHTSEFVRRLHGGGQRNLGRRLQLCQG